MPTRWIICVDIYNEDHEDHPICVRYCNTIQEAMAFIHSVIDRLDMPVQEIPERYTWIVIDTVTERHFRLAISMERGEE